MARAPYGTNPRHKNCIAPEGRQGTANAYSNLDCRCPRCREAWRVYANERRAVRKGARNEKH